MLMSIAKTVTMPRERIVSGESQGEDENRFNYALRPQTFGQYIGQETLIRKLQIAVQAARGRGVDVSETEACQESKCEENPMLHGHSPHAAVTRTVSTTLRK